MEPLNLPIEQLIPHRGAMRLIDRLVAADADSAEVSAKVQPGCPFYQEQGIPGWVGIEYMAQAIAAWAGVQALRRGETLKPGFLLGTRAYSCEVSWFAPGAVLQVRASREVVSRGLAVFACSLSVKGVAVAAAHLSVYQPPDGEDISLWTAP